MRAGLGLAQLESRPARQHLEAVLDVARHQILEVHHLRPAAVDRQQDRPESRRQLRLLVQVVQHHLADRAALELHHHADAVLVGLVAQVADAVDLLLVHQVGDLFDQRRLVHRIGDFGDDDPLAVVLPLHHLRLAPQLEVPPSRFVHRADRRQAAQRAAGREVRTLHMLHQVGDGRLGMVDQMDHAVYDFAGVVRGNVGGHADGDARRTVDQQIGQPRRQDLRFLQLFVVVRLHLDGVFVNVRQQFLGRLLQAALRVAVGRRRVAVDAAEVALPVNQQAARRERLRHAHQGVVHRRVAVRMVFADHVADHAGALDVGPAVDVSPFAHGEQDAPVAGLQPVARVRQRPAHDHRHRIVDVGPLHLLFDVDRLDAVRQVLRRRRRGKGFAGRLAAGLVVYFIAHRSVFRSTYLPSPEKTLPAQDHNGFPLSGCP